VNTNIGRAGGKTCIGDFRGTPEPKKIYKTNKGKQFLIAAPSGLLKTLPVNRMR